MEHFQFTWTILYIIFSKCLIPLSKLCKSPTNCWKSTWRRASYCRTCKTEVTVSILFSEGLKNILIYRQLKNQEMQAHLKIWSAAQLPQLLSTQSHAVTSITIYPRRTGTGTDRSNNIDIRWLWSRWNHDVLNFEMIESKGGRCKTTATWGFGGQRGRRIRTFPRKRGIFVYLFFFVLVSFCLVVFV